MPTCLYFDSVQFGSKLIVNCKHVAALDLLRLWLLGENSLRWLPTGQRLQRSHQLPFRNIRLLLDLLWTGTKQVTWLQRREIKRDKACCENSVLVWQKDLTQGRDHESRRASCVPTSNVHFSLLLKSMRMVIWKVETCRMCFRVLEPVTCAPPTPTSEPSSCRRSRGEGTFTLQTELYTTKPLIIVVQNEKKENGILPLPF